MPDIKLGCKPDAPDNRDLLYKPGATEHLPDIIDLRVYAPAPYDQQSLGSCTGNAIAGNIQCLQKREKIDLVMPSRLFIYYNERKIEGTINTDSGASIRDGFKVIKELGYPDESLWPYDISKFTDEPTPDVYKLASMHTVQYERVVQTPEAVEHCLASGFPITFGFVVYPDFMTSNMAATGLLSMPLGNEASEGGHAVLAVGYDRRTRKILVRNSWGSDWGLKGYFWMPYDYILNPNLAYDLWMLRLVD